MAVSTFTRTARRISQNFVARSDDRRLERTAGSPLALRLLFGAVARRFDPEAAAGFSGDLRFVLRTSGGARRVWTIGVKDDRAVAHPGEGQGDPALEVRATVADLVRMAAGQLHPARALLSGRLDLAGSWAVAARLGPMFGASSVV